MRNHLSALETHSVSHFAYGTGIITNQQYLVGA